MYEGSPRTLFNKYAIPQLFGMLFNSIYVIVDGIFIGNVLGTESMAAAGVAVPLVEVLIALSMALASGSGVLISGQLARKKFRQARETFHAVLVVAALFGAAIAVLGNVLIHPIADLLGATPDIHAEAVTYARYIITFSPFLLYSYLLNGLARNDGAPKLAMTAMSVGSVSNVFLDYLFMCPLQMGIGGAALATALGPIFSVLIVLPHFLLKKGNLYFGAPRFAKEQPALILELGFPSFIMEFTIGIVTFLYNKAIVGYGFGELGLAAYLVIGYLILIVLTLFLGIAEGLQPVFSYLFGAGETDRCERMRRYAVRAVVTVGIACYLLILFFSRSFYTIFNPGDTELITFAAQRSVWYFWGFFAAGFCILMISYWQSTQKTGRALITALMRSVIWPPVLILILPRILGCEALWSCHSIGECITAAVAAILLRRDRLSRKRAPR